MHKLSFLPVLVIVAQVFLVVGSYGGLTAEEPQILQVISEEAMAPEYSHQRAVDFLDRTSMAWTTKYKCFTCHTNFAHLIAVSELEQRPEYFQEVRNALDDLVQKRWSEKGPRWDAEAVMAAMTLTVVDRNLGKPLSQSAKIALDKMWQVQQPNGGFDWLKCDWPPMESDDQYGAVVAAVAVSAAPRTYLRQKQVQDGIARLETYLSPSRKQELRLHHRAILLWAQSLKSGWLTQKEIDSTIAELAALQRPDGGWNTPSLGKWDREDGGVPDVTTSDGYGTGFAVLMLIKAGMDRDDVVIQNGLSWLKKNQRQSGRWYTRSVSRDGRHFLTHAGTAMAIMAMQACDEHEEG
ncbi:squalene--hopene cyclase [bacterium]|nr:squalene--hopene cyclase [bacterium]